MLFNIYYDLLFLTGKNILQKDGYYMERTNLWRNRF